MVIGKNVTFYNIETLKETYTIELPVSDITDAEYKSNIDGTMVAMYVRVSEDHETIIVVDVEARTVVKVLEDEFRKKFGSDFSNSVSPKLVPNNKSFIVFSSWKDNKPTHFLYNLKDEKLIKELTDFDFLEQAKRKHESIHPNNCILLDDDIILSTHFDTLMRVWSTKDGSLLKRVAGHRLIVYNQSYGSNYISMYHTPKSPFILTCESEKTTILRLWDKKSFLQLSSLTLDKKIDGIEWNSDGLSFISYSEDPNVIVRWTIGGANVGKSTISKYPVIFKVNGSKQIPTLKFKNNSQDNSDLRST